MTNVKNVKKSQKQNVLVIVGKNKGNRGKYINQKGGFNVGYQNISAVNYLLTFSNSNTAETYIQQPNCVACLENRPQACKVVRPHDCERGAENIDGKNSENCKVPAKQNLAFLSIEEEKAFPFFVYDHNILFHQDLVHLNK